MKDMKRLLKNSMALLLALVMLLSMMPAAVLAEGVTESGPAAPSETGPVQDMPVEPESEPEQVSEAAVLFLAEGQTEEPAAGPTEEPSMTLPAEPSPAPAAEEDAAEASPAPASEAVGVAPESSAEPGMSPSPAPAAEESPVPAAESPEESVEAQPLPVEEDEPFEQSCTVDGVVVTVKAGPGVFPAAAVLVVDKVPASVQAQADAAVEAVRESTQTVAVSYTFDIRVLDADGVEVQPADGQAVEVSFALAEVGMENLDAGIYHITEEESGGLAAEKLEALVDGPEETVTTETEGFSLYTVEFTYHTLQYVLKGGTSTPLSDILNAVGLTGEATAVSVSNPELFSAAQDQTGVWVVTSLLPFDSEEWLKVTISGVEYLITVTDDSQQQILAAASAAPGKYRITVTPQRQANSDFTSMRVQILGAGNSGQAGLLFDQELAIDSSSSAAKWNDIDLSVTLSEAPAEIRIISMYALDKNNLAEKDYEELTFAGTFREGMNQQATADSHNYPGQQINFCSYSVRYLSEKGQLAYLAPNGSTLYREEGQWQNFMGLAEGGWYAVRETYTSPALMVTGDCNLVLCEGGELNINESGITVAAGAKLTIWGQKADSGRLTAKGANAAYGSSAGIQVAPGGTLIINSGSVTATGGKNCAGIGSNGVSSGRASDSGRIEINGGTVSATGGEWGAGIGSGARSNSGAITITGGTVNAAGNKGGAGIGGGREGDSGEITISGGTVKATGKNGAGIGGGYGTAGGGSQSDYGRSGPITITGGTITAESVGGAGIGGGSWGTNRGEIRISGGTVTATSHNDSPTPQAPGTTNSAGIGAGSRFAQGGAIIISGGATVLAVSEGTGAGIGGGAGGSGNTGLSGGVIRISGSETDVNAVSCDGAGIGSGGTSINGSSGDFNGGEITIDEGFVYARSYNSGAGIGGGNGGNSGKITINGGYVIAIGGDRNYDWAKENKSSDSFTGPGKHPINGWLDKSSYTMISDAILEVMLSDDFAGAGIGGGHKHGVTGGNYVHINGGYVEAKAGQDGCSAIGWGKDADKGAQNVTVYDKAFITLGKVHHDKKEDGVEITGSASRNRKAEDLWSNGYVFIEPGLQVTYDMQGHGTAPQSYTAPYGAKITEPSEPEAEGYRFLGWFADAACTQKFDFNWLVGGDTTIYAGWKETTPFPKLWSLEVRWEGGGSKPKSVSVEIEKKSSDGSWAVIPDAYSGSAVVLNEANHWRSIAWAEDPAGEYRLRERDESGHLVYDGDETGADPSPNPLRNEAVFTVNENGVKRQYHYRVTYEMKPNNALVITNTLDGIVYSVEKKWELGTASYSWPDQIYAVDAVLQHRETDADGRSSWKTLDTKTLNRTLRWKADFRAVPVDADENYRVREQISNRKDRYTDCGFVLLPDDSRVRTEIIYEPNDPESDGKEPIITYFWKYYDNTPGNAHYADRTGRFAVSCSRDENGNFILTNREVEMTTIAGSARWDDADNADGTRPRSITVRLLADGEVLEQRTVTPGSDGTWTWRFEQPRYSGGHEITYTIREDPVPAYITTADGWNVTNVYATARCELRGAKLLEGRSFLPGDSWRLAVSPRDGGPLPVDPSGEKISSVVISPSQMEGQLSEFSLQTIIFTTGDLADVAPDADGRREKTFEYAVSEAGTVPGVMNDPSDHTVKIRLCYLPSASPKLQAFASWECNPPSSRGRADWFVNNYRADGHTTLSGIKTLTGREFISGDRWTFRIEAEEGAPLPLDLEDNPVQSVTIEPAGGHTAAIDFGTLNFSSTDLQGAGSRTFVYHIVEEGSRPGVSNDPKPERKVKIIVEDSGNGSLNVRFAEDSEDLSFTNAYQAGGSFTFAGSVMLSCRNLTPQDVFTFRITDEEGQEQTVMNAPDGMIAWPTVTFTQEDTGRHIYRVKQIGDDREGITLDRTEYVTTLNVIDSGDGTLTVVPDEHALALNYLNLYEARGSIALKASKTMDGGKPEEAAFRFELRDEQFALLQEKTNAADGSVQFDSISYTQDQLEWDEDGNPKDTVLTYTVREIPETGPVTFDTHVETVRVTLRDDGRGHIIAVPDKTGDQLLFANRLEQVHLSAEKKWRYSFLYRSTMPEHVTVHLLADGKEIRSAELTEAGSWKHDFGLFNKYSPQHREISYTLIEDPVEDWTADEAILTDGVFALTNRYTPREYTLAFDPNGGTWSDGTQARREETHHISETVAIPEAPTRSGYLFVCWQGDSGSYQPEAAFDGRDARGNYRSDTLVAQWKKEAPPPPPPVEKIRIQGEAEWIDDNTESIRPQSITIHLMDGNREIDRKAVTPNGDGNWTWSFEVPKFDGEREIAYRILEDPVPGYTTAVEGYHVTNTCVKTDFELECLALMLDGKFHTEDRWTFAVTAPEGAPRPTDEHGTELSSVTIQPKEDYFFWFKLGTLHFSFKDLAGNRPDGNGNREKTFEYSIQETTDASGVTCTDKERTVTVRLSWSKAEGLKACFASGEESVSGHISFHHCYHAEGKLLLTGTKTLTGREFLPGDSFIFLIQPEEGAPLPVDPSGAEVKTVTLKADHGNTQSLNFGTLQFTNAHLDGEHEKTFTYRISESDGIVPGVEYDLEPRTVEVLVSDAEDGSLDVRLTGDRDALSFTNTYRADSEAFRFEGRVDLVGRSLNRGDLFTFRVTDQDGQSWTVRSDETGKIRFPAMRFRETDVGEHRYYVEQTGEDENGITLDRDGYIVWLNVTDNGDGTLSVQSDTAKGLDFVNLYDSGGSIRLGARKTLDGEAPGESVFVFELSGSSALQGFRPQQQTNSADGSVQFDEITYTLDDMFWDENGNPMDTILTYYIREIPEDGAISCDTHVETVRVSLHDDGQGSIIATADKSAAEILFENARRLYTVTYDPNGGAWSNGSKNKRQVTLPVTEGCRILEAPTRSGYTFTAWKGSSYQPGDVYNEKDSAGYYVSDTLVAQWEKKTTPSSPSSSTGTNAPKTGDSAKVLQWSLMMGGAGIALLIVAALFAKRRRKKKDYGV